MKIIRIEIQQVEFRLGEPYQIAYETFDRTPCVFLQLVTDGRHVGVGCAAPDPHVTGETAASIAAALEGETSDLIGLDPLRPAHILSRVRERWRNTPGSLAALDLALHDLLGKAADLPLWRLCGGFRSRMPTSMTISILPVDETLERARRHVAEGFRALKLKGGVEVERDIECLRRVRQAVGPDIALRFDANQGFDLEQTLRFVDAVRPLALEVIEQPVPSNQLDRLGEVTQRAPQPIMADESLLTLRDAFRLGRDELADMLNIKLMKVGGIAGALRVDAVARAARLETMVGCMDEPALGIGAGLAVALSSPNVEMADLDGHLDLIDDPTHSVLSLEQGELVPSEAPGLGLRELAL